MNIPLKYKPYVVPLASIVVLLVLLVVGGIFLLRTVGSIRRDITRLSEERDVLEGRETVLRSSVQQVNAFSDTALLALPDTNPGLVLSSQFRTRALELGLEIVELNVSDRAVAGSEDLEAVNLNAEVSGDYELVVELLSFMSRSLPLANLERVQLESEFGGDTAAISMIGFWAPLPRELPEITSPLDGLSDSEVQVLDRLSGFSEPALFRLPPPSETVSSGNPFSL